MIRPPHLIHPVKIELTKIDPLKTRVKDAQFGEPTSVAQYQDPVVLTGQLSFGRTDEYYQRPLGDDPQADGHVTFEIPIWQREMPLFAGRPQVPQHGDRITKLFADNPALAYVVDWSFIRIEPRGHYAGRPWLWFCFYRNLKTLSAVR